MRTLCLTLLTLVLAYSTNAQRVSKYVRDSLDIYNVGTLPVVLDTNKEFKKGTPLPFSKINVHDVRFDTAQIGLYSKFSSMFIQTISNYRINIADGVANGLNKYFNVTLKNSFSQNSHSIECFIKKFTVVGLDTLRENHSSANKIMSQLIFNADFFYKENETYHAAFKIDTLIINEIIVNKKEIAENIGITMIEPLLQTIQNKIASTNWEKVKLKKAFTENQVKENYFNNRFNLPILTAAKIKRGVYRNFNEFISNKPSIENFSIKQDKNFGIVLLDGAGIIINPITIFGFSNGNHQWITKREKSFPLVRVGNSFQYFWTISGDMKVLQYIDMTKGNVL